MPRKKSRQEVEAVGLSSAGTVHFMRTENGEPKTDGEIRPVNGTPAIVEGYRTFCGKLLDKEKVSAEDIDQKVDEYVEDGKHFCKSCRSNVRYHRNDIQ